MQFDDQRLDVDLRAAFVEHVDDAAQIVVDRVRRGDDQRVVGRIGLDESAAGQEAARRCARELRRRELRGPQRAGSGRRAGRRCAAQ